MKSHSARYVGRFFRTLSSFICLRLIQTAEQVISSCGNLLVQISGNAPLACYKNETDPSAKKVALRHQLVYFVYPIRSRSSSTKRNISPAASNSSPPWSLLPTKIMRGSPTKIYRNICHLPITKQWRICFLCSEIGINRVTDLEVGQNLGFQKHVEVISKRQICWKKSNHGR